MPRYYTSTLIITILLSLHHYGYKRATADHSHLLYYYTIHKQS